MNDGGDCRTAPATPGLLNIYIVLGSKNIFDHLVQMVLESAQTFCSIGWKVEETFALYLVIFK